MQRALDEQVSSGNFELMSVRFETFDFLRRDRESRRDFKGNRRASPLQIKVNRAQLKTS
jgi:hypothetical protein